jgi:hypothetical protein
VPQDGTVAYMASSPDEAALVSAAQSMNFVFHVCLEDPPPLVLVRGTCRRSTHLSCVSCVCRVTHQYREPTSITVNIEGEDLDFEILNILEFTSERKRMVPCVVCRVSCVVCRVSCVVCRVSCVVCRVSCACRAISYLIGRWVLCDSRSFAGAPTAGCGSISRARTT